MDGEVFMIILVFNYILFNIINIFYNLLININKHFSILYEVRR